MTGTRVYVKNYFRVVKYIIPFPFEDLRCISSRLEAENPDVPALHREYQNITTMIRKLAD